MSRRQTGKEHVRLLVISAALFTILWTSRFAAPQAYAAETASPRSVDECLSLWQSTLDEVWSFDVELRVTHVTRSETTGNLEPVTTYLRRHRYLRGMWRVDRLRDTPVEGNEVVIEPNDVDAIAWDGEELRSFRSNQMFGNILSLPDVDESDIGGFFFGQLFRSTFHLSPYVDMLRARENTTMSASSADGRVVLDSPAVPGRRVTYNDRRVLVELDPRGMYMPARLFVSTKRNPTAPDFEIQNVLNHVPPEICLPIKSVVRIYRKAIDSTAIQVFSEQRIEVVDGKLSANIDIDPSVFRLAFQTGAIVYDKALDRNFLVDQNGGRDYPAFNRWAKEYVEKHRASSSRADASRRWKLVLSVAILISVCALGVIIHRILRQRRHS